MTREMWKDLLKPVKERADMLRHVSLYNSPFSLEQFVKDAKTFENMGADSLLKIWQDF